MVYRKEEEQERSGHNYRQKKEPEIDRRKKFDSRIQEFKKERRIEKKSE